MADVTDAEAAPARAELIEAVMVPKPALDWLMGLDTDPAGLEFGEFPEDHPKPPGAFWWRKTFREICLYYSPRMLKAVLIADDEKDKRIAALETANRITEAREKLALELAIAADDRATTAEAELARIKAGTAGVRALDPDTERRLLSVCDSLEGGHRALPIGFHQLAHDIRAAISPFRST